MMDLGLVVSFRVLVYCLGLYCLRFYWAAMNVCFGLGNVNGLQQKADVRV